MRTEPTWRIPVGILALLAGLVGYAVVIARFAPGLIGEWPALAQAAVYLALGVVWLLPLKRFLVWMETGRFR
jgi:membrane protein YdbS with pleckstrin-like domain